jgi:predicted transcriptional regulator
MGVMPRENKTTHILWRVRPTFKKRVEVIADASGKNVSELLEAAVEYYATRKDVRDALAKASKTEEV